MFVDGKRRVLISPEITGLTTNWFDPEFWGEKARPVITGGRGGAWFVDTPIGDVVLRQYRRGGWVSRISRYNYLFTGYNQSRAFAEFRLLKDLRSFGLPVPEPLAAMADQNSLVTYQASIIIQQIQNAVPLPEAKALLEESFWQQVGAMIRRFHDAGLYHSDLNCDNILVTEDEFYLIDFDKCRLRESNQELEPWKEHNLSRLKRSVHKRCKHLPPATIEHLWRELFAGYEH